MNFPQKLEQTPYLGLFCRFLAIFGLLCPLLASLAVMANDLYYFAQYGLTPSVVLLTGAFLLAFLPGPLGMAVVIGLLPLTAGLPQFIKALGGISVVAMPNPGLDLVAGLFLGYLTQGAWFAFTRIKQSGNRTLSLSSRCPWPEGM